MHFRLSDPKVAASTLLRVCFGFSSMFVGLTHSFDLSTSYAEPGAFTVMVADGLGPLAFFGVIWSYFYPALLIIGGALFVIGRYRSVATWMSGLALASIPVGMLLKPIISGIALDEMMPPATTAFIWLIVYAFVVFFADGSGVCGGGACSCNCGCDKCTCGGAMPGTKAMPMPKATPAPKAEAAPKTPAAPKSVATAPSAMKAAPSAPKAEKAKTEKSDKTAAPAPMAQTAASAEPAAPSSAPKTGGMKPAPKRIVVKKKEEPKPGATPPAPAV